MYAALITWNYSLSDNTGFLLQRSTDSGSTWTNNYPLGLVVFYLDSAVVSYGTYWYKIAATNRYGTGSFSNTSSVFIPPEIPSAPHDLVVVSGSAILTWISGTLNEEYFAVQRSLDGVGFSNLAVTLVETYTDTAVSSSTTGNTYWYQVGAVGLSGTSSFSNTASITFIYDPPVGSITANVASGSSLLSWTSSIANADHWDIYKTLNSGSFSYVTGTLANTKSYRDNNVTSNYTGVEYDYLAIAVNSYGSSSFSNTASINFQWPPLAPINLVATSGSSMTILNWDSGSEGSDVFAFERSWDGGSTWIGMGAIAAPPAQDNTGVSGSYTGNTYSYRCYAYNAAGNSPLSETASITYTWPPLAPVLDPIASGSAIVTWVSQSNGADHFLLWRSFYGQPGTYEYLNQVSGTGSMYVDSDVTCSIGGQTYWYAVDQVNVSGLTSSLSNTQSITFTCTSSLPMAPILNSISSGSAILSWSSQSNDQTSFAVHMTVDTASSYVNIATVTGSQTTYTDTNVSESAGWGNVYWYGITAINGVGTSSLSNTSSITFRHNYGAYKICSWSDISSSFVPYTCTTSSLPEWDGVFSSNTHSIEFNYPIIYFTGSAIGGNKVAANESALYPSGNWNDEGYTQIYWDSESVSWYMMITCLSGYVYWLGQGPSDPFDPSGSYIYLFGNDTVYLTMSVIPYGDSCAEPPVPADPGYKICNWSTVSSSLTNTDGPSSVAPEWDGVFNFTTESSFAYPIWYFTGSSIGGKAVAADEGPNYPSGNWTIDTFAQIFFEAGQGPSGAWILELADSTGTFLWWMGTGPETTPAQSTPSGSYTRIAGDSAGPSTITVLHLTESCPLPKLVKGWWTFDDSATGPWVDAVSGSMYFKNDDTTPQTTASGVVSSSLRMVTAGGSTNINMATSSADLVYTSSGFTMTGWLKVDAWGNTGIYYYGYNSTVTLFTPYQVQLVAWLARNSNQWEVVMYDKNSNAIIDDVFPYIPVVGEWHLFRFSYDYNLGKVIYQQDTGSQQTGSTTVQYYNSASISGRVKMRLDEAVPFSVAGDVSWDEINWSNYVLTDNEMVYLYNSGSGRTWPSSLPL